LDIGQAILLGLLVFVSRYLTRGPVYFVDGPRLVRCIQNRTFVIQPPGYWLYARLGGLFPDSGFGLTLINEIFSAVGVAAFFLLCRRLELDRKLSWAAALCYGSIFYLWFAGDIQSSYASQILFPPLLVLLFLSYRDSRTAWRLLACGLCFALGSGLRPSDGAFLTPLFLFLTFQLVPGWRPRALLIATASVLCLAWYIPTQIASRAAHPPGLNAVLDMAHPTSVFVAGVGARSIANSIRVVLPLLAAFWMLFPGLSFNRSRFQNRMLAIWIMPGLLFFLLVYMADAVYLTYLTAAAILLVALSRQQLPALSMLMLCAAFNISLFLCARPLRGHGRVDQALDFYVVKYCNYGIKHQWISTPGHGGNVP
jgi:hypothetical protein